VNVVSEKPKHGYRAPDGPRPAPPTTGSGIDREMLAELHTAVERLRAEVERLRKIEQAFMKRERH
jgi:hypothetical protein